MSDGANSSARLLLASAGSYPRTGESPALKILEQTLAAAERGERSIADVVDAQDEVTRLAIADQVRAGLDVVTDGQIRWADPVSYLAGKLSGVGFDGSVPFFDAQWPCRRPILHERPARRDALVVHDFLFARNALGLLPTPSNKSGRLAVKVVLTGPYTLAKLSGVDTAAGSPDASRSPNAAISAAALLSLETRTEAYAQALADEIAALGAVGADLIQIDEPAILENPGDWELFASAIGALCAGRDAAQKNGRAPQLALHVYFRDCIPLHEKLFALPVDIFGLDFVASPKLAECLAKSGSPKPLAIGLVDGRSAALENSSDLARLVEKLAPAISGNYAYLGTSCGMASLGQTHAYAKLELLSKVLTELNGQAAVTGAH
jgi:5-methyltetrahydropteroyltriglutamate--homocysteine methyltransferase